jgi:hypothetical protein
MNIEFPIFWLKKDSDTYKRWSVIPMLKQYIDSDFIAVGEEIIKNTTFIKLISVDNSQICLIGGLMLDEAAYSVPKTDIEKTCFINEFDIPKDYLSLDTVENIQKVNERLSF